MSSEPFGRLRRFLRELKRRNVYKVAVAYVAVAFVGLQAARLLVPPTTLPGWSDDLLIYLAVFGFPITLVIAWAFEMTPEGMRRTPEAEPVTETEASEVGTRTAYKVLTGLGLVAAAVAGGWYLTGGGGESPEIRQGTVAVLPFEVSGSGTETWQDGMVTYLTPGLDGAAGLRAIPDRTVFAAWEESREPDQGASAEEALVVAREIGSQYAVVGSAGELGSRVRFTVEVYETVSGDRLGQVEVQGSPDSVPSLADSLTRRVLGVVLEEGREDLPSVDLGRITTRSLPALKSYLRGERHFRAGEYRAAIKDYEAAVEQDSSFALAYVRLARSHGWRGEPERESRYWERAYALSDRLPDRERRLVRANYLDDSHQAAAAADTLRRMTEYYSDDPALWYSLGEVIFHGYVAGGWPEAERAFRRAVELDPGMAPYHRHLVDLAFALHRDSALVAQRIVAHPDTTAKHTYRIAQDLVFGDSVARQRAWTRLDTISNIAQASLFYALGHPTDGETASQVIHRLRERPDVSEDALGFRLLFHKFRQGHLRDVAALLGEEEGVYPVCTVTSWLTSSLPLPDSAVQYARRPNTLDGDRPPLSLLCSGVLRIEQGRQDELEPVLDRLRAAASKQDGDTSFAEAAIDEVLGYRAWKAGDLDRAAELWSSSNVMFNLGTIWRGDLYRKLGQLETAEGWYLAGWESPLAHERLGQLYEEMNQPDKAAAAYRRFIAAWEDADPELQPRVEAARKRLKELTGSEAEADE